MKCYNCDRPLATPEDWAKLGNDGCGHPDCDGSCLWGRARCWGTTDCEAHTVDWRARALSQATWTEGAPTESGFYWLEVGQITGPFHKVLGVVTSIGVWMLSKSPALLHITPNEIRRYCTIAPAPENEIHNE